MSDAVASACPTWPTPLAWRENDLREEESQRLNTHVADCDECREKLAVMNAVQEMWGTWGCSRQATSPEVRVPGSSRGPLGSPR